MGKYKKWFIGSEKRREELLELCKELKKNKKASYEEENINYIVDFIEKDF